MPKTQSGRDETFAVNLEREDALSSLGVSLLPPDAATDASKPGQPAGPDAALMLVVSVDGTISAVLPGEGAPPEGLDPEKIPGSIEELWPPELCEQILARIQRAIRARHVQCLDSALFSSGYRLKLIVVPHGRDTSLVIVLDMSARESAFSRMRELAYVDRATELPTKEYLLEELERYTGGLRLTENRAALLCFAVDYDEVRGGMLSGPTLDLILKELASRLTFALRGANDRRERDADRYTVAARVDYRQYCVLLPSIESGDDAESVAQRLMESLQTPVRLGEREVVVTVSAGIALSPQDGDDGATLVENALAAAEDARNTQPGSYKFYSGTLKLRALQRRDLEAELKNALDGDELELHYLPIVNAGSARVVAVEALLRWPQAVFGAKQPQKVIALAERTGLIGPIGDWVVRTALEQLSRWHAAGRQDLRLALNLSMQQFAGHEFLGRLLEQLDANSLSARLIDVEITEYLLFRDALKDYAASTALRQAGLRVVVDDFGTGACSLGHFARSAADVIKIHNSFVASMITNSRDRAACGAMIEMAHRLGRKVIAEGVESYEQAELLKRQGCDYLQGFLYSKPVHAEELAQLLDLEVNG